MQERYENQEMLLASKHSPVRISDEQHLSQPRENMKLENKFVSRSKGEYNVDSHSLRFVIGIVAIIRKCV